MDVIEEVEKHLQTFNDIIAEQKRTGNIPEPSPLVISTMSAKTSFTVQINIKAFCKIVEEQFEKGIETNVMGMQYMGVEVGNIKKKKKQVEEESETEMEEEGKLTNKQIQNRFRNCASFVMQPDPTVKPLNIKLFSNCSISMTGCKKKIDGFIAVNMLIEEMKKHPQIFDKDEDCEKLDQTGYEITMIKSDFDMNIKINTLKLYDIIINEYNMFANYEPVNYAGLKINYMWNPNDPDKMGFCNCGKPCRGKKSTCKKITIIVFQSGRIAITGATTEEHLNDSYKFICRIFNEQYFEIVRFCVYDYMIKPMTKKSSKKTSKKKKK